MPTQPRAIPAAAEIHFGARTQTILAAIATAAPVQTTASTAVCQAPWRTSSPKGV